MCKGLHLEDDVFCRPSIVFTNAMNPRASVSRKDEYQVTLVKKGGIIGANPTVVCGYTLEAYCFVGADAVVTRDISAHAVVMGNPTRGIGTRS